MRSREDQSGRNSGGLGPGSIKQFERNVPNAVQGDGEVRIGRITCHQGNLSMADAAIAVSRLGPVHLSPDRAVAGSAHE